MTAIKAIIGHNNQATVQTLTYQPARREPMRHGKINRVPGGYTYPQGYQQTKLVYNVRERGDYPTIMTQFGLSLTVTSAAITIALDDDDGTYNYYNATASYEENANRDMNFWKRIEIIVNAMEEVSAP